MTRNTARVDPPVPGEKSAIEVFIPVLGMAPDDVTLVSWLKQPGDEVSSGEPIALVETSKAELEIAAETSGWLGPHLVQAGDRTAPGTTITHVLANAANMTAATSTVASPPSMGAPPPTAPPSDRATSQIATPLSEAHSREMHRLSPRQRREQQRLPHPDNERSLPPKTAVPVDPEVPSAIADDGKEAIYRSAIADAVVRSWREIPHFAVTRELHVGALVEALPALRVVVPSLTLTDLLLRGLALSMIERVGHTEVDIGLAVATSRGVALPVIRSVCSLDLAALAAARTAAISRAQEGRLHSDDQRTPASSLSNLGATGVDHFTGIVPWAQDNLLTVGRAAPRPVVIDGALAIRSTMHATLNADHRSWDGLHAGQLLDRLAKVCASTLATSLAASVARKESQ